MVGVNMIDYIFDYKKVTELGNCIISLDGQTVYNDGLITDEDTKLEAKVASLVYEEALFEYNANAKDAKFTFEDACKKVIARYGLNGETNDDMENRAIRTLLENEQVTVSSTALENSPYRILARTEKGRGIAVLRYKAKQLGFDIENLTVENNLQKGTIKISYRKKPLAKTDFEQKFFFDMTAQEKDAYASKKAEEAMAKGDYSTVKYWNDVRANIKWQYAPKGSTTAPSDEHRQTEWNASKKEKLQYATEQLDLAEKSQDEETAERWQQVIEDIENRVYLFEEEVERLYLGFQDAIKKGNYSLAKMCGKNAQNIIDRHPITMSPEKWNLLSLEEKDRYNHLKLMEAAVYEKKEQFDYWKSIYTKSHNEVIAKKAHQTVQ